MLVYVVVWLAFSAKAVSTCDIVYVVAVYAFSARAAVMSAVLALLAIAASVSVLVYVVGWSAFGTS